MDQSAHSAASQHRWRFSLALASSLSFAAGCDGSRGAERPTAFVGEQAVHQSVVDMVAKRDGLSDDAARAHVEQTLRLAQAAREQATARSADPAPLIRPDRRAHIIRTALARVWLDDVFEPEHRLEDIPDDEPSYAAALGSITYVHPNIHILCQVVATPTGDFADRDALLDATKDPDWMAHARIRLASVAVRMQRNVAADDPAACNLMSSLLRFESKDEDGVSLKLERGGFDLTACVTERSADGTCADPQWAPEWTREVAKASGPGLLPPFESRFGGHLVFVTNILPVTTRDDPATQRKVREVVGPAWQRRAFEEAVDGLAEKRAVRLAVGEQP